MIRGSLSHVDLMVADLARSVEFYDRVLGRLGYRRRDDLGAGSPCWSISDSSGGHFGIALRRAEAIAQDSPHDRSRSGVNHLAFHADDRADVDEFYRFLLSLGVKILDEPAEYDYSLDYYAVFFEDPDGLKLEVVHEPQLRGDVV